MLVSVGDCLIYACLCVCSLISKFVCMVCSRVLLLFHFLPSISWSFLWGCMFTVQHFVSPPPGNSPVHLASCAGHTTVVEELIASGAAVEVHNENGHTSLMEAASAGHVEIARLLLLAGAEVNTYSSEFKETALTLACYKGTHTSLPFSCLALNRGGLWRLCAP